MQNESPKVSDHSRQGREERGAYSAFRLITTRWMANQVGLKILFSINDLRLSKNRVWSKLWQLLMFAGTNSVISAFLWQKIGLLALADIEICHMVKIIGLDGSVH